MAFSTNLRGLRSVAMAVLVTSTLGYSQEISAADTVSNRGEKVTAGNKNNPDKAVGNRSSRTN